MLADLLNTDNRAFTLWRLKRLVFVVSLITFIWKNWGSNLAVAQFLWVSFIARQGDAPLNAFYVEVNEATTAVASSMALLMVCALIAWVICYVIDLFIPSYLSDAELKANRAKAAEHYKQITRETKGLKAAQDIFAENQRLRSELSKLYEDLQAIRIEATAIVEKRSKRKTQAGSADGDLFTQSSAPSPASKPLKSRRLPRQRRKPAAPKF